MPAILKHASNYPPHEWYLILKPCIISQDQLWNEMTKAYKIRTAARHLQACTSMKDTITKANLCMLRPEALKHLEKEASVMRKLGFKDETDIEYILLSMEQYDEDRKRMFKNRMQTIPEEDEFQLEARKPSIRAGLPLEVIDKIAELKQLLVNDENGNPCEPRLDEKIQQYDKIANEKATVDDPCLACHLPKICGEVEDHARQH